MLIYTERIGNARAKAKAKAKGFQLDYIIKEKTDYIKMQITATFFFYYYYA